MLAAIVVANGVKPKHGPVSTIMMRHQHILIKNVRLWKHLMFRHGIKSQC